MRNYDAVNIVIETEDASSKEECLRDVEKQPRSDVLYFEHLIGHQENAA